MKLSNNPDAEAAYLGSVLLDNKVLVDYPLHSEDFYRPGNALTFEAMLSLRKQGREIDVVTLCDHMDKENTLTTAGGVMGITGLGNLVPSPKMAGEYARIIVEASQKRKAMRTAANLIGALEQEEDAADAIDTAIREMTGIALYQAGEKSEREKLTDFVAWMENRAKLGDMPGVPTGQDTLDYMTHGWQDGDLIILAARPGMGKTALALNFALDAAMQDRTVSVFSLEMTYEQIVMRLLARFEGLDMGRLMVPAKLSDAEWNAVISATGKLDGMGLSIYDGYHSLGEILRQIRRDAAKGLDLVVIDYLQLIHGPKNDNRVNEIREITTALKQIAVEVRVPVICLSQLSRAVESRNDKHPVLSDLRESGSIEQDADLVLFLYREEYYDREKSTPETDLTIAKQRNGRQGRIPALPGLLARLQLV